MKALRTLIFGLCLSSTLAASGGCLVDDFCGKAACGICDETISYSGRCVRALPATPPLMPPFVADPRKVGMSAGWRWGDNVIDPGSSGPVSFGDYAALLRICNPFCKQGVLDIGIEGDVWAVFQQTRESAPLVNADYYVAIPITYGWNCWAVRLRFYHISSHIGDEYLLENPDFVRLNPSSEYVDLFVSWRPNCDFRAYAGIGCIARSDESYPYRKAYAAYGLEYYLPFCKWWLPKSAVLGRTFTGAHFRSKQDNDNRFDGTFVLGYEWSRTYCDYKKVRVYYEYHTGCSLEGQFNRFATNYSALVAYYGY